MGKKPPSWRLVKSASNNNSSLVLHDVGVDIKYSLTQHRCTVLHIHSVAVIHGIEREI